MIKKNEVFTRLLSNFNNLTSILKGSVVRNIWFNPLDYCSIFSICEPMYGQNNTSHVSGIANSKGEVKLVEIRVFTGEPIQNHTHIRGGDNTFANVLMVAQHELLHVYLNHFVSEVKFFNDFPEAGGRNEAKSRRLISYLQHIQLTRVHQLMDTGIGDYFLKLPDEILKVAVEDVFVDTWEAMFHIIWRVEPEYWDSEDSTDDSDDTVLTEVSDDVFDSITGIDPNPSKPSGDCTEKATTSITNITRDLPKINSDKINKYLAKKLDGISRRSVNGSQPYWDISLDIENLPIGMIEEYYTEPKGIILVDISGSMNSKGETQFSRYEIACRIISKLKGSYRVVLFNTGIAYDMPKVNMEKLEAVYPNDGTEFSCISHLITKKTIVITDAESHDLSILSKCDTVIIINNPKTNLKGSGVFNISI